MIEDNFMYCLVYTRVFLSDKNTLMITKFSLGCSAQKPVLRAWSGDDTHGSERHGEGHDHGAAEEEASEGGDLVPA